MGSTAEAQTNFARSFAGLKADPESPAWSHAAACIMSFPLPKSGLVPPGQHNSTALTLYRKRKIWFMNIVPMLMGNGLGIADPTQ